MKFLFFLFILTLPIFSQDQVRIKDCDKNSDISIIMMPVSNDFYGVSEFLNNEFSSACFDIKSNMNGLKYLDTKKLLSENINDFHLSEIGNSGEVDYVAHGFAYTINIPNKSSPTSVASGLIASSNLATGSLTSFIDALPSTFSALSNVKHQNMLAEKAGTYLLVTYYLCDIATGQKEFIYQNTIIQKLG